MNKKETPTLFDAFKVWLKISLLSFGGPAGQISIMHKFLVEQKQWISDKRFLHALNYCMLLPGPEAQQLATYIGWLLHRTFGGLIAGLLFIIPGVIIILILSILYAEFQELKLINALFFGLKAAVLAVVIEAIIKIGKRALKNKAMYAIAFGTFIGIFFLSIPFPILIIIAAIIGVIEEIIKRKSDFNVNNISVQIVPDKNTAIIDKKLNNKVLAHTEPSFRQSVKVAIIWLIIWLGPIFVMILALGTTNVFVQEGLFFSKIAVVTFGGAYAVLAYVAQQAVYNYQWLSPGEMLNGLGMAETTPGPLIMIVQFVGFMGAYRNPGQLDPITAGILGSMITTWVTFAPCFLWIFLGGPYIEKLRNNKLLASALSAITAAVVGVILNLAVWFSLHVIFKTVNEVFIGFIHVWVPVWGTIEYASLAIAVGALISSLLLKIGMIPTLLISAVIGVLYHYSFV